MRVAKVSIRKCYRNDFSNRMNRIFADNSVRFYMFISVRARQTSVWEWILHV